MRPPFSYRHDPAVPPFVDDRPIIIFDGDRAPCSGRAAFVLRHARAGTGYETIARSRLRWSGNRATCDLPDAKFARRLLA